MDKYFGLPLHMYIITIIILANHCDWSNDVLAKVKCTDGDSRWQENTFATVVTTDCLMVKVLPYNVV